MDDDVFNMLFKIILREYPHAKAGKAGDSLSQGDGEGGQVKAIRPIQNPAPLFDFMNLPAETLRPIFQSVLDGKMDLKTARKDARECKSGLKMANAFEKRFNALAGNQCKSKDKKKWISFKSIVGKCPNIPQDTYLWLSAFEKQGKMALDTQRQFEKYVEQTFNMFKMKGAVTVASSL